MSSKPDVIRCATCRNYVQIDGGDAVAYCALEPKWQPVSAEHYCSHWRPPLGPQDD